MSGETRGKGDNRIIIYTRIEQFVYIETIYCYSKTSRYVTGTLPRCEPRSAINQSGSRPATLFTKIN